MRDLTTLIEGMESSIGPLARTLNGCATFLKAVAWGQPWDLDPNVNFMPWNEESVLHTQMRPYLMPFARRAFQLGHHTGTDKKLCFAYFVDNGLFRVLPPVRRAMDMTVQALQAQGHTRKSHQNSRN